MKMPETLFSKLVHFCALFLLLILSGFSAGEDLDDFVEGDFCDFAGYEGTCLGESKCMDLPVRMEDLGLRSYNVGTCGFTVTEEMICCPNNPAPVQTPSPAPLDPFKPFEFRPQPEDEDNKSSTTVAPADFLNQIHNNNNKNIYNENQEIPLNTNISDGTQTQTNQDLTADDVIKETHTQIPNKNPPPAGMINERLNKLFNISPLPKEILPETKKPLFNKNRVPEEIVNESLNKFFNMNSLPKEKVDERKNTVSNRKPLPQEIVNKRVEGIFGGMFGPVQEDPNHGYITDELLKERINISFNANLTSANDRFVSNDLVKQRIESIFGPNIVPESDRGGENRVSDSVIKERLESILNAKPFTNTNRNGASIPKIPNKGKDIPVIKPLSRFNFFGIDGERPPPNNKPAHTGSPKIERPADRACKAFESIPNPPHVAPHIYGGQKVGPTEYRHMAFIVYDVEGSFCGGTLIHKRFVLTAAHCVLAKGARPAKVILGIANFNNAEEQDFRQEIDVKVTYVHGQYKNMSLYYDIGLLELAQDVAYSLTVYPTCLHTDQGELADGIELTATGWGRTENQMRSDQLLAVKLNYIPTLQCNESYKSYIHPFRLNHGIDETQFCAGAPDRDACKGDSGGPIHLVVDPAHNKYRVVGVVSFGTICGSSTPGVYTRVADFLDFIEEIVWPAETGM